MANTRRARVRTAIALAAALSAVLAGTTAAQAVDGADESGNAAYRFTARVQIGAAPGVACTGVLVAPQWVLTEKSCFAAGGQPPSTGVPATATTITVGRGDLSTATGHVLPVAWLVPHPDRDVVLARLSVRVTDVAPARIAGTPPQTGDTLRVLGFGRTHTEWVPDRLHGADVTTGSVGTATIAVTSTTDGTSAVCKGDAGGPAVRAAGSGVEVVGLHHASGQLGCDGTVGGTADVTETRVDDLGPWIAATTISTCNAGGGVPDQAGYGTAMPDFTGDCVADVIRQTTAGLLFAWQGTGDLSAEGRMFLGTSVQVGSGWSQTNTPRIVVGDFTGDGRTDIVRQSPTGQLIIVPSSGTIAAGVPLFPNPSRIVGGGWTATGVPRILTADFNGDGRTDIGANYADGGLRVWPSTGDVSADSRLWVGAGSMHATIGLTTAAYPRLFTGDFTGDGFADIIGQDAAGKLKLFVSTGNASAAGTLFTSPPVQVGSGWTTTQMPRILVGDFNADGRMDICGVKADGSLHAWTSTGVAQDSKMFVGAGSVSTPGFTVAAYPRLLTGDADGDGRTDIVAHNASGRLEVWRSTGDASGPGTLFPGPAIGVGSGWTPATYPRVF